MPVNFTPHKNTVQASDSQTATISKDLTGVVPTELTGDIEASTAQLDYEETLRRDRKYPPSLSHYDHRNPRIPQPTAQPFDPISELRSVEYLGSENQPAEIPKLSNTANPALWSHYSYLNELIDRVSKLENEVSILKSASRPTSEPSAMDSKFPGEENPAENFSLKSANLPSTYLRDKSPAPTTQNISSVASVGPHQTVIINGDTPTLAAEAPPQKGKIQYRIEYWKFPPDPARDFWGLKDARDVQESQIVVPITSKRSSDLPAFVVTQRINESSEFTYRTISIVSNHLIKAFRGAFDYYGDLNHTSNGQIELDHPYTALYHRWEYLLDLQLSKDVDEAMKIDLDLFLNFFHEELGEELRKHALNLEASQISYEKLPMIFQPGDTIINVSETGNIQAYICMKVDVPRTPFSMSEDCSIECWTMDYDGHMFKRVMKILTISKFEGTRSIITLSTYPIRLVPEKSATEIREMLVRRGKRYYDMRKQAYRTYNGYQYNSTRKFSNARFMIDLLTYRRMHPEGGWQDYQAERSVSSDAMYCGNQKYSSYDNIPQDQALTEEQLLMLPCFVYGYFMKDKIWLKLNVSDLSPIQWNKKAFEQLVLAEKQKNLVRALVHSHTSGARSEDIIADKGNGMISLLHGPPGVGKTLTAESVAEIAERPLYMVTCGDIGTEAVAVEKYLNTVFFLAGTWDAVLLLDEADVFLEERGQNDLQRNSLVSDSADLIIGDEQFFSVFLSITKAFYFLQPTESEETFDEAFQSRIHVAIRFPTLDEKSRKMIWHNFIEMLDEETTDIDDIKAHITGLAKKDFNGRQIRNTMGIVKALARYQGEDLGWRHFRQVVGIAEDFTTYLRDIHGHTNEDWAGANGLR